MAAWPISASENAVDNQLEARHCVTVSDLLTAWIRTRDTIKSTIVERINGKRSRRHHGRVTVILVTVVIVIIVVSIIVNPVVPIVIVVFVIAVLVTIAF